MECKKKSDIILNLFYTKKNSLISLLLKINNNQPILIIFEYEYRIRYEISEQSISQ